MPGMKKPSPRQVSGTYRGKNQPRRQPKPAKGLSKAMQAEKERNKKRGNKPI